MDQNSNSPISGRRRSKTESFLLTIAHFWYLEKRVLEKNKSILEMSKSREQNVQNKSISAKIIFKLNENSIWSKMFWNDF